MMWMRRRLKISRGLLTRESILGMRVLGSELVEQELNMASFAVGNLFIFTVLLWDFLMVSRWIIKTAMALIVVEKISAKLLKIRICKICGCVPATRADFAESALKKEI